MLIAKPAEEKPAEPIVDVHVLLHGFPLCLFDRRVPREWPAGHRWVGVLDRASATCATCRIEAAKLDEAER